MQSVNKRALRATKHISRLLLVVLLICQVLTLGFTEYNSDNLYSYQWGLKNNGNFMVDRALLASNHNPFFFVKELNDMMFYDSKEIVDYFKAIGSISFNAYAEPGFDTNWEDGYIFFKNVSPKREAIIAVIDTGVDINHYELKDSVWTNRDEIPGNGIDDDLNGYVDDIHGYNFHHKIN